MDISTIPKTFWHAISLSVFFLTGGFLFIAYKSTHVSVEIANTKINLTKVHMESISIKELLEAEAKRLEMQGDSLLAVQNELITYRNKLERVSKSNPALLSSLGDVLEESAFQEPPMVQQKLSVRQQIPMGKLDEKLQQVEKTLRDF